MTDLVLGGTPLIDDAHAAATATAAAAGVDIRTLDRVADLEEVRRLYDRIWGTGAGTPAVTADLLKAMVKAGSYVSGAYDGDALVGACCGFFSAPARWTLHSHITGVLPRTSGRSVGFALKAHQRAWALSRGAAEVSWTFDPLIRRNAWFNVAKLAADATEYLPDFYGPIDDDINRGDPTDRLLVRWALASPAARAACAGRPRLAGGLDTTEVALDESAAGGPLERFTRASTVLVRVPSDIETMRERDPACAGEWRIAVREVLGGLLGAGGRVRGFDRAGWYVVDQEDPR